MVGRESLIKIEDKIATENVQALLIFPLAEEWGQVLLTHGCMFGVHEEYGEIIQLPKGTTRTLLYNRELHPTNQYRILLPDGLELREVLDDKKTGKSWLTLVLSQEQMEDVQIKCASPQTKQREQDEQKHIQPAYYGST